MTAPRDPSTTPGESEFGWGELFMPDPNAEDPHSYHEKKKASRTNRFSDNPDYIESYDGEFPPRSS